MSKTQHYPTSPTKVFCRKHIDNNDILLVFTKKEIIPVRISIEEWFIKHKVSSNHMSLDMAIGKATDSLILQELWI